MGINEVGRTRTCYVMIKAEDIRKGNFLIDEFGDVRKVVTIEKKVVEFEHKIRQYYKDLTPILLTNEWKEKLGIQEWATVVETDAGEIYHETENWFYIHSGLGDPDSYGYRFECFYVHEIQNLYYLLTRGLELTIKA